MARNTAVTAETVRLTPVEADRVARERLGAFQQKGVRIKNVTIASVANDDQQRWKDLQDRRWQ